MYRTIGSELAHCALEGGTDCAPSQPVLDKLGAAKKEVAQEKAAANDALDHHNHRADDNDYDEATTDAVDTASRLFSEPSEKELALLKKMLAGPARE